MAGQNATLVTGVEYSYPSYSGFFTVNEQYNSNQFFWFFPAQSGDKDAPVLMWLQGGPGSSSMFGLFEEMGPFSVSAENFPELVEREITWVKDYSIFFVDNPVGAGFSFTEDISGFVTNQEEVGANLYSVVTQFFQLFPDLADNDFYVTGESYAGKYVPSCAYTIHQRNQDPNNQFVNLVGISVGDGMMDPITQTQGYATLLYELGMMDEQEVVNGRLYENNVEKYILLEEYETAFTYFDQYLNDDFYPWPSYYMNVTGLTNYYNFLTPTYPPNPYQEYLILNETRSAIHVGNYAYQDYNATVEKFLIDDWMRSVRPQVEVLLDNYKVLIYNGQNDIILAGPLCENFLRTAQWSGQDAYLSADKIVWKIESTDTQVAGYAREVGDFRQVIVRNAGHLLPLDQPERAYDMITRFVNGISFAEN